MIETALTAIATAVTTVILPKAIEAVGKKLGDTAFDKGGEIIKATHQTVKGKLQEAGTVKLLDRAENQPTEANRQVLEAELVSQMGEDEAFAQRLEELVKQLKTELPEFQSVLEDALIKGDLEMGKTTIKNEGKPQGKQTFGKGLKVGGNAKIGDMTIENKSDT